jgi:hypothetical protein
MITFLNTDKNNRKTKKFKFIQDKSRIFLLFWVEKKLFYQCLKKWSSKKGAFLSSSINLFSACFGLGPEFEKDIFQIWSAILLWKLNIKS